MVHLPLLSSHLKKSLAFFRLDIELGEEQGELAYFLIRATQKHCRSDPPKYEGDREYRRI
jgi:hypothetical protein